jgi:hypothetical protein
MAGEAQVLANRRNARQSTGPRTAEGKAVVSQNAVRHGLLGREVVIQGEDRGEFEFYRERMLMYERRTGQSLYRTMAEFQRQRLLRELNGPAEDSASTWDGRPDLPEEGGGQARRAAALRTEATGDERPDGPRLRKDGFTTSKEDKAKMTPPETPDGVTTSASCETNPICPAGENGQAPCVAGLMSDSPRNEADETKPIPPVRVESGVEGGHRMPIRSQRQPCPETDDGALGDDCGPPEPDLIATAQITLAGGVGLACAASPGVLLTRRFSIRPAG